jgi:hypothetical protein
MNLHDSSLAHTTPFKSCNARVAAYLGAYLSRNSVVADWLSIPIALQTE